MTGSALLTSRPSAQMTALVEMENSGLVPLLVGDGYEDLARMYALFRRVDGGLDLLRSVMGAHLKKEGSQLVQVRVPGSPRPPCSTYHVWHRIDSI